VRVRAVTVAYHGPALGWRVRRVYPVSPNAHRPRVFSSRGQRVILMVQASVPVRPGWFCSPRRLLGV